MILNYLGKRNGRFFHRQIEFVNGFTFMRMKVREKK